MRRVAERDVVRRLDGIPQCSIGAPLPLVLADESAAVMAFYLEDRDEAWDGTAVRVVDATASDEPIAIVRFRSCYALQFGPPNDEAFSGHPLAARGLEPYGAFVIDESSWLLELERRNAVHRHHGAAAFLRGKRHFVLTFHDSIVECIAESFDVTYASGAPHSVLPRMQQLLTRNA